MRTKTVNLYRFDELSDEAKSRAIEYFRQDGDLFAWHREWEDSIKTFCYHFGVRLVDWSVGSYHRPHFSTDAANEHFRGVRLRSFDRDHMPTGYCGDLPLWATFYDEFKRTGDAKSAFDAALSAGFNAWQDDIEHAYSDEGIADFIDANEYEFLDSGKLA